MKIIANKWFNEIGWRQIITEKVEDPRTNTLTHKCASLNTEQTPILLYILYTYGACDKAMYR